MTEFFRLDGRNCNQIRAYSAEIGFSKESVGSARLLQGATEVVSLVYGPSQPRYSSRHEKHDRAVIEIDCSEVGGNESMRELKDLRQFLLDSIVRCVDTTKYPRMLIVIKVSIVRNDGACISTAFNSCILGLIDAGISMNTTALATSLSHSIAENRIYLDPTKAEEQSCQSSMIFVTAPIAKSEKSLAVKEHVTSSKCVGTMQVATISAGAELATISAIKMRSFVRDLFAKELR